MLDDRLREVLDRLERKDANERARDLPAEQRSRAVAWADLIEGDALEEVPAIGDVFDVVFLDAEKDQHEALFQLAREKLEPGAVVVADNVLSHERTLGAYSRARQSDPTLSSVTVPLDRGLELSVVLR